MYWHYLASSANLVAAFSPLLIAIVVIESRRLRLKAAHPLALGLASAMVVVGALVTLAATLPEAGGAARGAIDLNPFSGTSDSPAFKRLILINLVLLPMPLGAVTAIRWPQIARTWILPVGAIAFYVTVELLQYLGGGERVASAQDLLLCVIGFCTSGLIVSNLQPIHELHRRTDRPPSNPRVGRSIPAIACAGIGCALLLIFLVSPNGDRDDEREDATWPGAPSVCGLPTGPWAAPARQPGKTWADIDGAARPSWPDKYGPGTISGARGTCFARNPTGALYAAAWSLQTDAGSIAGYKIESATPDHVELIVATFHDAAFALRRVSVRWVAGDWKPEITDPPTVARSLSGLDVIQWSAGGVDLS